MIIPLGLKAFFGNKLVQYGLLVIVIALLVMGGVHAVKSAYKNLKADIRQQVTNEFTIKELNNSLEQAMKDKEFWEAQAKKNDEAVEALRRDLGNMSNRVTSSHTIIREQIASGQLQNGKIPPVKNATMDQIDIMERERVQQEASK